MNSGKNLKDRRMNKSIDALKLALEALKFNCVSSEDGEDLTPAKIRKAITAIREALASKSEALDEDQAHYKQVIDGVREMFDAKREKNT